MTKNHRSFRTLLWNMIKGNIKGESTKAMQGESCSPYDAHFWLKSKIISLWRLGVIMCHVSNIPSVQPGKKKKTKSEREKTLNTFSTRNGTPHFTNVRRIITVTEHHIMVFSSHTRELFLLRVSDSEPSTSGILSSFGITNLTYSLSSLPSPPWFFSNCSVESGILLIYQMSA